jgi:hypothetical protein
MTGMPPSRSPRARTVQPLTAAAAALLALSLVACAEPALPEANDGEGAEQPVEAQSPDPGRDALIARLQELRTTVAATRDELASAMDAPDAASARRSGDRAVTLLVDAPELEGEDAAPSHLFPSTTVERGSIEGADDLLTATLTAARDAGGSLGRAALELLRDPLAGDLGSWQQDPAGVVAAVRATIATSGDLPTLERAVMELPGEGTRALAWALLTAEARHRDVAVAYAERGVTHLELILVTFDDLLDGVGTEDAEADVDIDEGGAGDEPVEGEA